MKYLKQILVTIMFLSIGSTVYGDVFFKDDALVKKLKAKQVQLIVFRHNEALNNFQDVVSSSRSPGYNLTDRGLQDLRDISKQFASKDIQMIFTSPLYRSLQATQILGDILNLPPEKLVIDERLVIQNFGTYEGRSYEEYKDLFCSFDEMLEKKAPQGEFGVHVFNRTRKFLWELLKTEDTNILVVSHAFNLCHINMCLTGEFGNLPLEGEYVVYDFKD